MTENSFLFILLYSLVQGITEFIPISSSGHLNIIEFLLNGSQNRNLLFETTAHFSSLIALIVYLQIHSQSNLKNLISKNFKLIAISFIPALFIGIVIKTFNLDFLSLRMIAYTSIVGAIMLFVVDRLKNFRIKNQSPSINFFIAGIFQCLAFLPGFSRSGCCITAFLILNKEKKEAITNSLLMSFPIIFISFLSNAKDLSIRSIDTSLLLIFIITFISAYITLFLFIKYINKIGFTPYIIYRILLGIVIIYYLN